MSEVMNGYLPERWYDYFTVLELSQADGTPEKDWKRIFYTQSDALADEETEQAAKPEATP
jgi:hypothetical protein